MLEHEILSDILEENEKILWLRKKEFWNFIPDDKKPKKTELNEYNLMKQYHPDDILRNYPCLEAITNRHFVKFESPLSPYREEYPIWFNEVDINAVYEYRNEFCLYAHNSLTGICKNIYPKKNRFEIGLYYDINDEFYGDDAPNYWLTGLKKEEFINLVGLIARNAPQAKLEYLNKKSKKNVSTKFFDP